MRILLIQPPNPDPLMDRVFLFEPLGLEYVGAGLRGAGHEVGLLDARLEPDVAGAIRSFSPGVVGITGFTSHLNIMKSLAAQVKHLSPEARVVIGGHHATVKPDDFLHPAIDAVVIGEGVFTMLELVEAWQHENGIEAIPGIAIPESGAMRHTPPRPHCHLDALPVPDRSLTAGHRSRYFSEWFRPLASVRTSLGCTARCNFCSLWSLTGGKYLRRDPQRIVDEISSVDEPNIFFCDDESMCDAKRMSRLADLLEERGVRKNYFLYARVDTIARHPDLFEKWKRVGLAQVFVGMEDFSDERLTMMNKGASTAHQIEAVRVLDRLGIHLYASFMVDPSYDAADFDSLKRYVRRLKLSYATFSVKTPLPGTQLRETEEGRIISDQPELYDMLHSLVPTKLPPPEFYRRMAELYSSAIPLYRALPVLARFGWHGLLLRIRVFRSFLQRLENAHLDFEKEWAA